MLLPVDQPNANRLERHTLMPKIPLGLWCSPTPPPPNYMSIKAFLVRYPPSPNMLMLYLNPP